MSRATKRPNGDPARLLPLLSVPIDAAAPATSRWEADRLGVDLENEWKALCPQNALFLPAAREICRRHGLPAGDLERLPGGSTPVFAVGPSRVLKLYCPYYRTDFAAELAALHAVHGAVTVPTPEVVAHGSLEGWPYLVMSRLEGRPLSALMPELSDLDRQRLMEDMGRALASLHAVRSGEFPEALEVDWPAFLEERERLAAVQQERRGLGPPWLGQIVPFLAFPGDASPRTAAVVLHTEPTDSAWLLRPESGRLALSGLIDFADSMAGDREYDFPAVGIFVARGDRALFRRFLLSYGYAPGDLDESLRRRLMRLTLLHRYCHLPWFLSYSGVKPREATLDSLADAWFGCG